MFDDDDFIRYQKGIAQLSLSDLGYEMLEERKLIQPIDRDFPERVQFTFSNWELGIEVKVEFLKARELEEDVSVIFVKHDTRFNLVDWALDEKLIDDKSELSTVSIKGNKQSKVNALVDRVAKLLREPRIVAVLQGKTWIEKPFHYSGFEYRLNHPRRS